MYTVVELGGRQIMVEVGRLYTTNRLNTNQGSKVSLNRILLENKNSTLKVGEPYVKELQVKVTVVNHYLRQKLLVFKMKPKKKMRCKNGYRQKLSTLFVGF